MSNLASPQPAIIEVGSNLTPQVPTCIKTGVRIVPELNTSILAERPYLRKGYTVPEPDSYTTSGCIEKLLVLNLQKSIMDSNYFQVIPLAEELPMS